MTDPQTRAKLVDFLNAFKADPFSTGESKVDRLIALASPQATSECPTCQGRGENYVVPGVFPRAPFPEQCGDCFGTGRTPPAIATYPQWQCRSCKHVFSGQFAPSVCEYCRGRKFVGYTVPQAIDAGEVERLRSAIQTVLNDHALELAKGRPWGDLANQLARAAIVALSPPLTNDERQILETMRGNPGAIRNTPAIEANEVERLREALDDAKSRLIAEGYLPDGEVIKRYSALTALSTQGEG